MIGSQGGAMEIKRKLKYIFYAFALLLVIGVIGYMKLLKVNFVDALYMTVITISTVGFGEVGTTTSQSEIFSVFMIFFGVGIVGKFLSIYSFFKDRFCYHHACRSLGDFAYYDFICAGYLV